MSFERLDVALLPFPFVQRRQVKLRPVLVLTELDVHQRHGFLVTAMITTAAGGRWPSDDEIDDLASAGLRRPCVVRWKLFSLPVPGLARRIGVVGAADRLALSASLSRILPTSPASTSA